MRPHSHRLTPLALVLLSALFILPAAARDYVVRGPQGGLAMKVTLPDGRSLLSNDTRAVKKAKYPSAPKGKSPQPRAT